MFDGLDLRKVRIVVSKAEAILKYDIYLQAVAFESNKLGLHGKQLIDIKSLQSPFNQEISFELYFKDNVGVE